MELRFATRDLERICADARRMQRALGAQVAKALKLRIAELTRVEDMADLLLGTGRWEELTADRSGQWSARLTGNKRLVVQPGDGDDVVVLVVEIIDYHH
jgi:proteic killer suppression protein